MPFLFKLLRGRHVATQMEVKEAGQEVSRTCKPSIRDYLYQGKHTKYLTISGSHPPRPVYILKDTH